jgi:hypothetical protein
MCLIPVVLASLVEHVVEHFYSQLEDTTAVSTFKDLKMRYEQNLELKTGGGAAEERDANGAGHADDQRKAREQDEDEAYFDGDDDNEAARAPMEDVQETPGPPLLTVPRIPEPSRPAPASGLGRVFDMGPSIHPCRVVVVVVMMVRLRLDRPGPRTPCQ